MKFRFRVYGPFKIPRVRKRRGGLHIDKPNSEFWEDTIGGKIPALPNAIGCYVFCVNTKPWYVGKTENSFKSECFTDNKVNIYNRAYYEVKSGTPRLFLLARLTNSGALFRKPPKKKAKGKIQSIDKLELMLIGMALKKNPKLLNVKGTKWLKEIKVEGFLNTKRNTGGKSAKQLRGAFGINRKK
ncbi:MAG: hypothetical protein OXU83_05080 [Gammaproteobacteria bacterium]|nr:hypothetical protein [Gammaproteobacteria bacterium]